MGHGHDSTPPSYLQTGVYQPAGHDKHLIVPNFLNAFWLLLALLAPVPVTVPNVTAPMLPSGFASRRESLIKASPSSSPQCSFQHHVWYGRALISSPAKWLRIEMLESLGSGTAESCIHFVISSSISKFMLNPGHPWSPGTSACF